MGQRGSAQLETCQDVRWLRYLERDYGEPRSARS